MVLSKESIRRAVETAAEDAESDTFLDHNECRCSSNLMLYLYLRELQKAAREEYDKGVEDSRGRGPAQHDAYIFGGAAASVKDSATRVWSKEKAKKLKGVGDYVARVIQTLFNAHPPDDPTAEELQEEKQTDKAAAASAKAATAKGAAKGKKRAGAAASASDAPAGTATGAGAPKAKKAKKAYVPGYKSNNYAFMITLYKQWCKGLDYMGKAELMKLTEDSRLATRSVYGFAGNPLQALHNKSQYYDGWSCFKELQKKDPPLTQHWSNPVKVKLTEEGRELAERLCEDAVLRKETSPPRERRPGPAPVPRGDRPPDAPSPPLANEPLPRSGLPQWDREGAACVAPRVPLASVGYQDNSNAKMLPLPSVPSWPTAPLLQVDDEVVIIDSSDDEAREPQQMAAVPPAGISLPQPPRPVVPCRQEGGAMRPPAAHSLHIQALRASAAALDAQLPSGVREPAGSGYLPSSQDSTGSCVVNSQSDLRNRERGEWRLEELQVPGDAPRRLRVPPIPAGKTFSDVYDVVLLVDQREHFTHRIAGQVHGRAEALEEHVNRLKARGIKAEIRTLLSGDAIWVARSRVNPREEYVMDAILERKRVDDLIGSIKSGRHETQKYFMRSTGLRMLYYLVEGECDCLGTPSQVKAVKTASIQNEIIHGYRVLRTDSLSDTFELLSQMTLCFAQMFCSLRDSSERLPTYNRFCENVKAQKQVTVRDVWGKMLTMVPGVASNTAIVLLEHYPTPHRLWKAYCKTAANARAKGANPHDVCRKMLEDLKQSTRRIGPVVSKNVYDHLFGSL